MTGWVRVSLRGGAVLVAMVLAAGMTEQARGGARAWVAGSPVIGARVAAPRAGGGIITTVAGGVGGPGPASKVAVSPCAGVNSDFNDPLQCDVTFAGGRLYVTDAFAGTSVVRSVDFATGRLATPVGDGVSGFGGDGGRARSAEVNRPGSVSADRHGNLIVADTANNRIRVVAARRGVFYGVKMTAGHIYTVAGTGAARTSGNGGPARKAGVFSPSAARVDRHGNLVIAQNGLPGEGGARNVLAKLRVLAATTGRFYGLSMRAGDIYTIPVKGLSIVGLGAGHLALRIDHAGNLVLADSHLFALEVVAVRTGTFYGKKMTVGHMYRIADARRIGTPAGVAVDVAGNLVVPDFANNLVRVLAVKTGTFYGQQMTAGGVYTIAGTGSRGFSGDGGPATSATLDFRDGTAVSVDAAGNVAVADSGNARVRVVAVRTGTFYGQHMTAGDIYTIAGNGADGIGARFSGDGGVAIKAEFYALGVASNPAGEMAVASLVRVRFVPARPGSYFGQPMAASHIYPVAGNGRRGFSGDGGLATQAEIGVVAVALDHAGNLILADEDANAIRVVAIRSGTFYGLPMTAGDIYTVAGTGPVSGGVCGSFAGDGGPATAAALCQPNAVTVDNEGNLLFSDSGFSRVRALAVKTGRFYGQAMTAGDIYTIAGDGHGGLGGDGGPATKAGLVLSPGAGLAVDGRGNLMVTEEVSVRMVAAKTGTFYGKKMTKGNIYTIARAPGPGFVLTVATDPANNVIFGEATLEQATLVKVLAARSGRFYGHQMTANHIYTAAGGGRPVLGDGGPATAVALAGVQCLAVGRGGFLIAEISAGRVREVSR